ncbi:hypothetical protein SAMN05192583_0647 [Sphingomonas gellani]|uniref:Uncharacterized protein n=1 Tax=Sphingomonas gellani TaxID=1166340 RepID=A0A1H7ZDC8_9SPHN|nr:hypothetical protein [Sphingomonas gellani]SEM56410.1 hypothetical protein SAMN05192583_0647 [Sphingomonas gellani]
MIRRVALVSVLTLVGGCSHDTMPFPSLSPRPAEMLSFAEPATLPEGPVQPDPALDGQITSLAAQLNKAVAGFDTAASGAERAAAAARNAAVGSDAWLNAQTALAGLDDWHAQTSAIITDVEQLAIDRAATLARPYPALSALTEKAHQESERQNATIQRLQSSLKAA